jgi:hypothetical protein
MQPLLWAGSYEPQQSVPEGTDAHCGTLSIKAAALP